MSTRPYEPPEEVVAPAFRELLRRLRQARAPGDGLSDDERRVFESGVAERKKVLENTLTLVFAQWVVYRGLKTRVKSRVPRMLYGAAAAVGSLYYIRSRATRVSHEMFADIVALPTSSPTGNEARIVLAELEGPEGAYFRTVSKDRGFHEDLESVIAALDAREGLDPHEDNLHPQLRLRPRLLQDPMSNAGPGAPALQGRGAPQRGLQENKAGADQKLVLRKKRPKENERGEIERVDIATAALDAGDATDGVWARPFDFAAAAVGVARESEHGEEDEWTGDDNDEKVEGRRNMSPSQQRAAERKVRRERAKERAQAN